MSAIAVFGGSGFIGKNILNISNQYINISLRDSDWKKQVNDEEIWLNLVGKAHDHKGVATQEDYDYVNVQLVKEIFQAFILSKATTFIHISSLAALEEFESDRPLSEEDECHPVSWYGQSKRMAEKWLMEQQLPANKKLIILRPPMVHGPGDKGNLGLLYKLIARGIPYPLAAFNNRRSFISIDNFCYFIEQIINNKEKMKTGIYHIADDEPLSTGEIIEVISRITGRNTWNIAIPKFLIQRIAKIGDVIPIPLNTNRLRKMTSNLLISNQHIKEILNIDQLPITATDGLRKTIKSFSAID